MITPTMVYWVTRLDALIFTIGIILFALIGLLVASCYATVVAWAEEGSEKEKAFLVKCDMILMVIVIVLSIMRAFIPTTKEAAIIYIAPKVYNSDFVQKDVPREANELYALAKEYLKNKIKEEK